MAKDDIIIHQFPKGQTGNPNGRPKGKRNRSTVARMILESKVGLSVLPEEKQAAIRQVLESFGIDSEINEAEIYLTISQFLAGMSGDSKNYIALMDSGYGKPAQPIEYTEVKNIEYDFSKLTADEFNELEILEQRRDELLIKCERLNAESEEEIQG